MRGYRAWVLFRVLGPVEVECSGDVLSLARRQERCLLGILLLEPGRMVPVDRLCDLVWEENPPEQARRGLQSHVARIRAMLARAGADRYGVALNSHSGGYLLRVDPERVDAHRFRSLVRQATNGSSLAQRDGMLREALALWRGPVLHDAGTDWLREHLCADLTELRLHAVEESMDVGIALGRHRELVPELAQLAAVHPTRERLIELHMVALHRAGRTAEALGVFAQARAHLADDLGLDPGPQLTRLHQSILRGESFGDVVPAPQVTIAQPAPHVPRCLPRDIGDFTGRHEILARLLAAVPDQADAGSVILTIDGMPGVGKTALAVHLAHRVANRYPDGQLAIDLHGHSKEAPTEPAAALDTLLRQLGVAGDRIPDGIEARMALWRSELAGRRVLLLLDNAATSEQTSPLLPAGSGCLTLVTSRRRLAGLDGVRSFSLAIFGR